MTTLLRVCLAALAAVVLAAPVAAETAPKVDVDLLACGNSPTTAFVEYMQSRKVAPMLASTGVQPPEDEYADIVCRFLDDGKPFVILISDWCPACGTVANICMAEAWCRRKHLSYEVRLPLYCPAIMGFKCPDATACFQDRSINDKDAEIVQITPQDDR